MGNLHNIDRSYRLNHREVSLNSHPWVGDHWFALWRFVCVDIFSCTCNFWRYLVKYSCGSMYLLFQLCLFHVLCCFASTVDVNPRQLNCVRASEWCRGVLPSGYCKQTLRSLLYSEGEKAPLNSWWYSEVSWMSFWNTHPWKNKCRWIQNDQLILCGQSHVLWQLSECSGEFRPPLIICIIFSAIVAVWLWGWQQHHLESRSTNLVQTETS